jgi:hypothetical protein
MPAYFVHRIAGEKVLRELKTAALDENMFVPGLQGADLFFFYKYKRPFKRQSVSKFASILHRQKTKEFFRRSMLYIKEYAGPEKEALVSYFCGYIVHYCVDKGLHPFVFGRVTGMPKHNGLEFTLDALYVRDEWEKQAEDIDIFKDLYRLPLAASIGKWYEAMDEQLYQFGMKGEMAARAHRDFADLRKTFRHPGFYVYTMAFLIRLFTGTDIRMFLYPRDPSFLYFSKEEYEDLKKLVERAAMEAAVKIRAFLAFSKGEIPIEDVTAKFEDVNFRGEPSAQ